MRIFASDKLYAEVPSLLGTTVVAGGIALQGSDALGNHPTL